MYTTSRPKSTAEKATRTVVDTISFSRDEAAKWVIPPFQRPLRVNEKVRTLAEIIRNDGGVIPGIITFGKLDGETYLLDGQHRREAFLISEKKDGFSDARTCYFKTMAEMGEEFVNLNSRLVTMRPDDMLRGMEGTLSSLQFLRSQCPFVGYDSIRRGTSAPILSMSLTLRAWEISRPDVPGNSTVSALMLAQSLHEDEFKLLANFLKTTLKAWGRDQEYYRLWGGLNLALCMWLYRRTVLSQYSPRSVRLNMDQFCRGMMSLSASVDYLEWLAGRRLCETDRAPAYTRITTIVAARLADDLGKIIFPRPAWTLGKKC